MRRDKKVTAHKKSKKTVKRRQKSSPSKTHRKPVPITKRLVAIKGDKRRRFRDKKTGKIISRRQADKLRRAVGVIKPRTGAPMVSIKYAKYITLRDIYISSQHAQGNEITKREAMQSVELRQIIRGLHSSNVNIRQAAFDEITGGDREEWVPYIERWVKGNL